MHKILVQDTTWQTQISLLEKLGIDLVSNCYFERGPITEEFKSADKIKIVIIDEWTNATMDLSCADLVISINQELVNDSQLTYIESMRERVNNPNVLSISGGISGEGTGDSKYCFYPMLSFALFVVMANTLCRVDYNNSRPFLFDALLGGIKNHRKYIVNRLKEDGLLDQSLVSIAAGPFDYNFVNQAADLDYLDDVPDYCSAGLLDLEEDAIKEFRPRYSGESMQNVFIAGTTLHPSMSHIVPNAIYHHSWYSIIAETNFERCTFLTEKTFKPIFAKRIFVAFSAPGHLAFLRQQGFQTFGCIIDESYDLVLDNKERARLAWDQVRFLATANPVELYKQVMPILEHNFRVLITTPATNTAKVRAFIDNHVAALR